MGLLLFCLPHEFNRIGQSWFQNIVVEKILNRDPEVFISNHCYRENIESICWDESIFHCGSLNCLSQKYLSKANSYLYFYNNKNHSHFHCIFLTNKIIDGCTPSFILYKILTSIKLMESLGGKQIWRSHEKNVKSRWLGAILVWPSLHDRLFYK